jgi:ABC-type polar amino acid transport system ATPase subunit
MPILALRNIVKRYGTHTVLDDVSLDVEAGRGGRDHRTLGSGKTTLLRCINGLEAIDGGSVVVRRRAAAAGGPRCASCGGTSASCSRASTSFRITRSSATSRSGRPSPTRCRSTRRRRSRSTSCARSTSRTSSHAYPAQLSGGQQQRVAIAARSRCSPRLMLFDEITSALDPELVGEVVKVLERLASSA